MAEGRGFELVGRWAGVISRRFADFGMFFELVTTDLIHQQAGRR